MPRKASYTLPAMEALPARLMSLTRERVEQQMRAAEAIIPSIDPRSMYALGATLERIVGTSLSADGAPVAGAVLRADLVTLVLDLSEQLALDGSERHGSAATPEELPPAKREVRVGCA